MTDPQTSRLVRDVDPESTPEQVPPVGDAAAATEAPTGASPNGAGPVSYTHLTLPTIYSV